MAVFTPVNLDDLNSWLSQFLLDKATGIKGILSGIKNRNFFINTETGEYVVTVFEKLTFKQLPFYLELMPHLAHRDIAVPTPIANKDGAIINVLHGKPAAIVSKLAGESQMSPGRLHCREVGETLAKMHLAAQDFPIYQPNLRGMSWWRDTTMVMLPFLSAETQQLMRTEMVFQEKFAASQPYKNLPNGPVYADLFRNNVMFDGDRLSGVFDFYFAGCDTWLFDLAGTVNDWFINVGTGELDVAWVAAMLDGYRTIQPFSTDEQLAWSPMLGAAALCFWLSRLYDFLPLAAEMLTPHDPTHFERILRQRIAHPAPALF